MGVASSNLSLTDAVKNTDDEIKTTIKAKDMDMELVCIIMAIFMKENGRIIK